jgi:hypothetical protein
MRYIWNDCTNSGRILIPRYMLISLTKDLFRRLLKIAILVLATYNLGYGQKNQNNDTYNTRINKAELVQIESGRTTILHADTVIFQTLHADVYFYGSAILKDTTGTYTTLYYFNPKDNPGVFKFDFVMNFDHPILGPEHNRLMVYARVGMDHIGVDSNDDYTAIHVYGSVSGEGVFVRIRSKAPLFTKIRGVAGRADPNTLPYTIFNRENF